MMLGFAVGLGLAAIILLALALCRISARAERTAQRMEQEKRQES